MNSIDLLMISLTAIFALTTFLCWRARNEKRDIALMGAFSGLCGLGAVVAFVS